MTTNEYALDILTFSESHANQDSKPTFKRTAITKPDANEANPGESLQTIPVVQVEEVLTYSNFPFNKSQPSIQGTQEDLDKLFSMEKSNVPRTIQVPFFHNMISKCGSCVSYVISFYFERKNSMN